jgi:hypothetical protein
MLNVACFCLQAHDLTNTLHDIDLSSLDKKDLKEVRLLHSIPVYVCHFYMLQRV